MNTATCTWWPPFLRASSGEPALLADVPGAKSSEENLLNAPGEPSDIVVGIPPPLEETNSSNAHDCQETPEEVLPENSQSGSIVVRVSERAGKGRNRRLEG